MDFASDFTEIYSYNLNKNYSSIGSDNGLAPTRRQTIIWTIDGYFTVAYMRLSASMSFNWAVLYLLVDGCDNSALNIRLVSLRAVLSRSKRNCYSPRYFSQRLLSSVDYVMILTVLQREHDKHKWKYILR